MMPDVDYEKEIKDCTLSRHPEGPYLTTNGKIICSSDEVINIGYNKILAWAKGELVRLGREDLMDNLPEEEEEELEEEIDQPSAEESAPEPPKKKVIGKPITKENAKQYQLSAARAKRLRKEARAKMLDAMCNSLDLGAELVKAFKSNDDKRIAIVEKALRIVGLTHDQSQEAIAQKLEFKGDLNSNHTGNVKLVIEDMTKKVDG